PVGALKGGNPPLPRFQAVSSITAMVLTPSPMSSSAASIRHSIGATYQCRSRKARCGSCHVNGAVYWREGGGVTTPEARAAPPPPAPPRRAVTPRLTQG